MKINVCVFSENNGVFIKKCIDSILNQSYVDFDVIVYDNGSTDNTIEVLEQYGREIKLYQLEHKDPSKQRCQVFNDSITSSDGDFWFQINGDEFLNSDFFKNMSIAQSQYPETDWIYSGINLIDENKEMIGQWNYATWPTDPFIILKKGWVTCSLPLPIRSLIKLDFLRNSNIIWENFDYGGGNDILFSLESAKAEPIIVYITNNSGLNIRQYESKQISPKERFESIVAIKKWYLDNFPPEFYLSHKLFKTEKQICDKVGAYPSDDLVAVQYFLIAASLWKFRESYLGENNLYIFDEAIRNYCSLSIRASEKYSERAKFLLDKATNCKRDNL